MFTQAYMVVTLLDPIVLRTQQCAGAPQATGIETVNVRFEYSFKDGGVVPLVCHRPNPAVPVRVMMRTREAKAVQTEHQTNACAVQYL